jgi:hypothetical protein
MAAVASIVLGSVAAATGLASFGMGLSNAAKAREAQAKAEKESKLLMAEAEKKAEKNFYEGLNVPLDAFNAQFEQQLQQQQQGLQALQEGDARAVASGVGRVGALAGQQGEQTRIAMGEALYANNKMKADAKQAVNQQLIKMNVGQAADENARQRDAMRQENQAMQQGMKGLGSALSAGNDMVKLYQGDENTRTYGRLTEEQRAKFIGMNEAEVIEQIKLMTDEERTQLKRGDGGSEDTFDYSKFNVPTAVIDDPVIQPSVDPVLASLSPNYLDFNFNTSDWSKFTY